MTTDRQPGDDREEPPFVLGLLMSGSARLGDITRRVIASIDRRVQLFLWGVGTVLAFLTIVSLSIAESPDFTGLLRGVFTGLFLALLFAVAVGWTLLWASRSPRPTVTTDSAHALDDLLAPTLRELNIVRGEVIRNVRARSMTRVPLGILGGLVVFLLGLTSDDPPGIFELILFLLFGALAGEVWAVSTLDREYRRLYKDRVLPRLAARFGNLTYRHASLDSVHRLSAARILPEFETVEAEDEIAGTHRGLRLAIIETRLQRRSGKETRTVFDGLLIELTLPRSLTGTTVVLTDKGVFGNLEDRWRSSALERVRLEDPRFEKHYEVYSNDQIEARALLTPSFMERFMGLADRAGFSLPGAMAEGQRLLVALPKGVAMRDLFEPPVYWKPAGGQALVTLEEDIRAVLKMADVVIALDFWAAGRR